MASDEKTQADKFRDLARELDADEDEAAFEEQVREVAKVPRPQKRKASED